MSNSGMSLYEQSMEYNCEGIRCLENAQREKDMSELKEAINCGAYNTRQIRNVDHERPLMFPEYRFQHLNYCTIHKLDVKIVNLAHLIKIYNLKNEFKNLKLYIIFFYIKIIQL